MLSEGSIKRDLINKRWSLGTSMQLAMSLAWVRMISVMVQEIERGKRTLKNERNQYTDAKMVSERPCNATKVIQ